MKTKHILIAIASLFIIESLNNNLNMNWQLYETIEDMLHILLGICLLLLLYKLLQTILEPNVHAKKPIDMKKIEQELDEIEAELNAFDDEKVTPIWDIPNKKP